MVGCLARAVVEKESPTAERNAGAIRDEMTLSMVGDTEQRIARAGCIPEGLRKGDKKGYRDR